MNYRSVFLLTLMFVSLPSLAQTPPFDVRLRTIIGGTMQWTSTIDPSWVEFEETSPGSNVWMITLADTSANDPNTTWTFTGTGNPLPSIASFEQEKLITGSPVSVIISGTPEIVFADAAVTPNLGSGCLDFSGLVGANTDRIQFVLVASGDVSGDIECRKIGRIEAGDDLSAGMVSTDSGHTIRSVTVGGSFTGSLETTGTSVTEIIADSYTADVDIDGDLGVFEIDSAPITGTLECDALNTSLAPFASLYLGANAATAVTIDDDLIANSSPVLVPSIYIDGDFSGQIVIDGDMLPDSSIVIDGRLLSPGDIDIQGEMMDDSEIVVGQIAVSPGVESGARIMLRDELRDDAVITVYNDFNGLLLLDDLEGDVTITGDVGENAKIYMDELRLNAGRGLFIGDALAGQVIINQQDNASTWDGYIWVNGYEIQKDETDPLEKAPHYAAPSVDQPHPFGGTIMGLGGGAIGLVPFAYYATDTIAANGSYLSVPSSGPVTQSIDVVFYGPVLDLSASGDIPVTILKAPLLAPSIQTDVSEDFTVSIDGRVMTITAKTGTDGFECPFIYTVEPVADDLVCDDLTLTTVDVDDFSYSIEARCMADLSMNGSIDIPDPILWMQSPVDVDGDGIADTADLGAILDEMDE